MDGWHTSGEIFHLPKCTRSWELTVCIGKCHSKIVLNAELPPNPASSVMTHIDWPWMCARTKLTLFIQPHALDNSNSGAYQNRVEITVAETMTYECWDNDSLTGVYYPLLDHGSATWLFLLTGMFSKIVTGVQNRNHGEVQRRGQMFEIDWYS